MRFSPNKLLAWFLIFLIIRIFIQHRDEISSTLRKVFLLAPGGKHLSDPVNLIFFLALVAAVFGTMRGIEGE